MTDNTMTKRYQRGKQVYLLVIVLSVLWYTTSVYLFGISWSLYCLFSDIRLVFTSLDTMTKRSQRGKQKSYIRGQKIQWPIDTKEVNRSHKLCFLRVIVLSVLWFTSSVYLFGISWSLYCLSSGLWLLFTSLVSRSCISEDRQYNDQEIPKR
jgi:hypothetical protein